MSKRDAVALTLVRAAVFFVSGDGEMPDEIKPGETPPIVTPPAGDPPAAPEQPKPKTIDELASELAEAQRALKAANNESAGRRKKLEALEQAEAERKQSEMTEAQKLKARLDKAEADAKAALAKANERILRAEIISRAAALNFADANDAYALIDKSKLTVGDDGAVEGVDEALKELVKAKPYMLKKAAAPNTGPTNPGNNAAGGGETREQRNARLFGGGGGIFDASTAAKMGGGVMFPVESNEKK